MKFSKLQIGLAIATILTIGVNAAANILPFNGLTTADVSALFQTYFVPAGYVFSIWIVIYALLLIFSFGLQTVPEKERGYVKEILPWYVLASIANSLWIVAWHYNFFLTTVMLMLTLFTSLSAIYTILKANKPQSIAERIVVHLPFQVYLGWISVALIANISDVAWWLGFDGFGVAGQYWAAGMMIVAGLLGGHMIYRMSDYAFGAVILWALAGIMVKFNTETSMLVAGTLAIAIVLGTVGFKKFYKPSARKAKKTIDVAPSAEPKKKKASSK